MKLDPIAAAERRCVYFAKVGEYLKVGCSTDPGRRVQQIRTDGCAKPADLDRFAPVELLRVIPGGHDLETAFLASLIEFHVEGEWFEADPQVLTFVLTVDADEPWPYLVRSDGLTDAEREQLADAMRGLLINST